MVPKCIHLAKVWNVNILVLLYFFLYQLDDQSNLLITEDYRRIYIKDSYDSYVCQDGVE